MCRSCALQAGLYTELGFGVNTEIGNHMGAIFSDRLVELKGDLSVRAFAKNIGFPQQTIDRYIKGESTPNADVICAVCQTCGVTSDWLLGLSNKGPPSNHRAEAAEAKLAAVKKSLIALVREL